MNPQGGTPVKLVFRRLYLEVCFLASSIENLYIKYSGRVQRYLENDPYYQYLLEMAAGGKTEITQINRVLDKIVDERWIAAIEEAVPAIHEIIAHPRRFLKTTENVVPVEQVKRVNNQTVRHLASHTQYISGMRGGEIYPGRLLTTETDESMDLYENRFVNTLIYKVSEFIEKRTSAIFWDTGDEEMSLLRMDSEIEDDYELVNYKLELTIKNKQTYLENDNSKIEVFKRIDHVRRVMSDFRASTFCAVMAETPRVRSPIQRTNQIVKNPDYRKCYDLWQFLEGYDQVGYTINVKETALDVDEDYFFQMYGNLALNYTVFKSLLEHDQRRVTDPPKRRKTIKPKFIKQIVEEFVDDYDLPDVEIRKVIIEEVTKAQMEIERRARERAAAQAVREKEKEKLRLAKEKERAKQKALKAKETEKANAIKAKEQEKLKAAKAKEAEKAKAAKAKEAEKAKAAKAKEAEKAKAAKAKEAERAKAAKAKEAERAKAAKAKEAERAKAAKAKEAEKAKAAKAKKAEKAKTPKAAKPKQENLREKQAAERQEPLSVLHLSEEEDIPLEQRLTNWQSRHPLENEAIPPVHRD